MTVGLGDIVLYTPLVAHRHMMPPWFVELLDAADPGTTAPGPIPPCAAIVGGCTGVDRYQLLVLVPNQAPMWVDDVAEGTAPGTFWRRWQDVVPTPDAAQIAAVESKASAPAPLAPYPFTPNAAPVPGTPASAAA